MSNSARSDLEAARPLFAALAIAMLGNGLLGTIVGIRAELEKFPTAVTGLVMSSYYVGFLVGCGRAPPPASAGPRQSLPGPLAALGRRRNRLSDLYRRRRMWAVFRFVTGAATAGIYVVCESWLAGAGPPQDHGDGYLAVYLLVVNAGYGLGQLLLGTGSPQSFVLFGIAGALIALGALPLDGGETRRPAENQRRQAPSLRVDQDRPAGRGDIIRDRNRSRRHPRLRRRLRNRGRDVGRASRAFDGGRHGRGHRPAMADRRPLRSDQSSPRDHRRRLFWPGPSPSLPPHLDPLSNPILACMFGFTAFSFPLYSLAISHVNDALHPENVIPASAALLGIYGVGTLIGPIGTSLVIEAVGPPGFWLLAAPPMWPWACMGSTGWSSGAGCWKAHHLPPLPVNASPQAALLIEDTAEMPSIQR